MFKIHVHYDVRTQPTQFQTCLAKLVVFCLYNKSPILHHYLKYEICNIANAIFCILHSVAMAAKPHFGSRLGREYGRSDHLYTRYSAGPAP